MGQFGDKFRKAREAKGISLDDVSNATKITSRMLQAIEQEHFDQLPGGVFNKGFIRAYAKHLGLNDEDAVNDYLICLRQAQVDAHEVWDSAPRPAAPEKRPLPPYRKPTMKAQPAPRNDDEELPDLQLPRAEHVQAPREKFLNGPPPGIPWSMVAVAAVILVFAIVLWTRHSSTPRTQAATPPVSQPAPTSSSIATPPPTPTATTPAPKTQSTATSHAPTATTQSQPSANSVTANLAAARPAATSLPPATTRPIATPAAPATSTAQNNTLPAAFSTPPPPSPANLNLTIRATETSWISVIADGKPVSDETLIAPAHASFRAARQIEVRVGNAAGVTFLWNGKEFPAQGAESEAKTLIFDATGMRSIATPTPNQ